MRMRARRCCTAVIGVLTGCAAAVACGAGPANVTHHPTARSRSGGIGGRSPAAASGRCNGLVRLGPGVTVPPWRLGAIDFLSPRVGVALTAAQIPCTPGRGQGISFPPQQVRLAVTRDGGREWVTHGQVVAESGPGFVIERVAAASVRHVWALTASGNLLETRDGGRSWTRQRLPAPVVDISQAGATLWALACPRHTPSWCRPVLERLASQQAAWQRLPVPPLRAGDYRL